MSGDTMANGTERGERALISENASTFGQSASELMRRRRLNDLRRDRLQGLEGGKGRARRRFGDPLRQGRREEVPVVCGGSGLPRELTGGCRGWTRACVGPLSCGR